VADHTHTQIVTYTALPNGVVSPAKHEGLGAGLTLRLSVLVSPRLTGPAGSPSTLQDWPDWVNWPDTIGTSAAPKLSFKVRFEDDRGNHGVTLPAERVAPRLGFYPTSGESSPRAGEASSTPDPDLWKALFGPDPAAVGVDTHQFDDYSATGKYNFYANPLAATFLAAKDLHTAVATVAPRAYPVLTTSAQAANVTGVNEALTNRLATFTTPSPTQRQKLFKTNRARNVQIARRYAPRRKGAPVPLLLVRAPAPVALTLQFHAPKPNRIVPTLTLPPLAVPSLDFHQILSALAQHPSLQRALGLIIDLEVHVPANETHLIPLSGGVRLVPHIAEGATQPATVQPRTWYDFAGGFLARSHPDGSDRSQPDGDDRLSERITGGMLPLGDVSRYTVIPIDADGAALKLNKLADNLAHVAAAAQSSVGATEGTSLPALRSTGLTLAVNNRKDKAVARFGRAANLQAQVAHLFGAQSAPASGNEMTPTRLNLYAEDLAHGYRIDVWDEDAARWHSLCDRQGAYHFPANPGLDERYGLFSEEGFVAPGATQGDDPDPASKGKTALYLPEPLFRWHGWSLVAPRPGLTLGLDGKVEARATAGALNPQSPPAVAAWRLALTIDDRVSLKLASTYWATPGSLPRLRFGHTYRLRARVVDLAGNSVALADAPDPSPNNVQASPLQTYYRYDPVIPPAVIPAAPIVNSLGESLERPVIRSTIEYPKPRPRRESHPHPTPTLASRLEVTAETSKPARHVAPPRGTPNMAETYGLFDDLSPEVSYKIITSYLDHPSHHDYFTLVPDTHTTVTEGSLPTTAPNLDAGTIEVHAEGQLELPYLPDPGAYGVAFVGLPGYDGVFKVPFGGPVIPGRDHGPDWPRVLPFRLWLVPSTHGQPIPPPEVISPSDTKSTTESAVLRVHIPPGRAYTVRYSSLLYPGGLNIMGVYQWIKEAHAAGKAPAGAPSRHEQTTLANDGQNWLITPYRELTLVHAATRPLPPLDTSGAKTLTVSRKPGDTTARLYATIPVDGPSTAKLDLLASWTEYIDDPTSSDSPPRSLTVHAHVTEIAVDAQATQATLQDPPLEAIALGDPYLGLLQTNPYVEALLQPNPAPQPQNVQRFGDTKHRVVLYEAVGATRFAEYFPPPIGNAASTSTAPADTEPAGAALPGTVTIASYPEVNVPSSARPLAPKVLHVLPSFGWESSDHNGTLSSTRVGRLRVYVDRPWYSSGEGELLGVVFKSSSVSPFDIALLGLGSYVGETGFDSPMDPLESYKPYVTQCGQDPTMVSAPVLAAMPGQTSPSIVGDARRGQGLSLDERPDIGVDVDGYAVFFDPERNAYFADVAVPVGDGAYFPFVRLALVRYQPDSIAGVELSRVVVADFAQLAPDRTASVSLTQDQSGNDQLIITLTGVFGVAQVSAPSGVSDGKAVVLAPQPNDVDVVLEQGSSLGDEGWVPVSQAQAYLAFSSSGNNSSEAAYPSGVQTLENDIVLASTLDRSKLRLVFREYEYNAYTTTDAASRRRLVYAASIDVSSLFHH